MQQHQQDILFLSQKPVQTLFVWGLYHATVVPSKSKNRSWQFEILPFNKQSIPKEKEHLVIRFDLKNQCQQKKGKV